MKTYMAVFDREIDGRIIASVPGVPGCHAYGRTPRAALAKVRRALEFYLEELKRQGKPPPHQIKPVALEIHIRA